MAIFLLCDTAFALRGIEKGARLPDLEFAGISGTGGKLSGFAGEKGIVVIYWATWSSRSSDLLAFAEKELRRYEKHGLRFLAVNADHAEMPAEALAQVKAAAASAGVSFPVVLDPGLRGYNEIGIISVPTVIILDNALVLYEEYPGFPSVARDEIPERLDAFLGIPPPKRPEATEYLLAHTPRNHAMQYFNLGKRLFLLARTGKGVLPVVPANAIEKLDEALRRDPDYLDPLLLKAIVFNEAKDFVKRDAALRELAKRGLRDDHEKKLAGFDPAAVVDAAGAARPEADAALKEALKRFLPTIGK
ncbi:MAG TPA: redoxin domain-containing protein [Candidatus Deferrimicrobiaceae bacterium]